MGLNERASAVAPYVQQLLDNQEMQEAIGRAGNATRDAYARAWGKSPREAVSDKKLRRRVQQAVGAAREAWSEVDPPRRKRGRLKLVALAVGGTAVFVAANAKARENVLGRLSKNKTNDENAS